MIDVGILQGQLDALKTARRSGAVRVAYGDKSIEYRTDAEMQAAIASLENEIAAAQGIAKPRIAYVRSTKGY